MSYAKWTERRIDVRLVRATMDFQILKRLEEKPRHGYALIDFFRRKYGIYFGPSAIYPILDALEVKGYVKSRYDLAETGRPRKVYTITSKGSAELKKHEDIFETMNRADREIGVLVNAVQS